VPLFLVQRNPPWGRALLGSIRARGWAFNRLVSCNFEYAYKPKSVTAGTFLHWRRVLHPLVVTYPSRNECGATPFCEGSPRLAVNVQVFSRGPFVFKTRRSVFFSRTPWPEDHGLQGGGGRYHPHPPPSLKDPGPQIPPASTFQNLLILSVPEVLTRSTPVHRGYPESRSLPVLEPAGRFSAEYSRFFFFPFDGSCCTERLRDARSLHHRSTVPYSRRYSSPSASYPSWPGRLHFVFFVI